MGQPPLRVMERKSPWQLPVEICVDKGVTGVGEEGNKTSLL